jgi:hypothetical protein
LALSDLADGSPHPMAHSQRLSFQSSGLLVI